jgi:hypothetical protein
MLWIYVVTLTLVLALSILAEDTSELSPHNPIEPNPPVSVSNTTSSDTSNPASSPEQRPLTHKEQATQEESKYKWCPDVKCPILTSDGHDLCLQKWLFILATGRSGSTSILESFNIIDSVFRLRGEFGGAMSDLVKFNHNQFIREPSYKHNIAANTHDIFDVRDLLYDYQQILIHLNPPAKNLRPENATQKILGFKEIQYNTPGHLSFLKRAFPCSRIIYNYRNNVSEQKQSAFFKDKVKITTEELASTNELLKNKLSQKFKETTTVIALEDFGVSKFNEVLEWMNINKCRFKKICHSNDNDSYRWCGQSREETLEGDCEAGTFDPHALV